MTSGMTVSKIAISLPEKLLAHAKRAVARGRAETISAYVAGALTEQAKLEDLAELLNEMLAESGGPMTTAERRTADDILGVSKKRKRRAA
jgi:alkylhydroperoxidase/carboxymuconolactone decarboxylase family protein YurZ